MKTGCGLDKVYSGSELAEHVRFCPRCYDAHGKRLLGRKMGRPCNPERAEAKKRGEMTYFTGLPCHRGHISPRYTQNAECKMCAGERYS